MTDEVDYSYAVEDNEYANFTDSYYSFIERLLRNECIALEELEKTVLDRVEFQVVMGVLYSLIWLMGTTSNALILYVVLTESTRTRHSGSSRRSSSSSAVATSAFFSVRFVFVASLACADLLTSLTSLPVTSIYFFTRQWPFPKFVCHVIGVFQGFSIFQSSFTFTSIAVDRYLLILYPHRTVMTKEKAIAGLTSTAFLSLLLACPMGLFAVVLENPEVVEGAMMCGRFCVEEWPENSAFWDQRLYGIMVLLLQFGLPTIVTSWCYWRVACRLRGLRKNRRRSETLALNYDARRQSCVSGASSSASTNLLNGAASVTTRRQRTNRMMLAMVAAFVLSWSPHNILNLSRDFGWNYHFAGGEATLVFPVLYSIAHLIGMTTLIWNPLLYAGFNKSIRDSLKLALCWRWRSQFNSGVHRREAV